MLAVALSPDGQTVAWLQKEPTGIDVWKTSTDDGAAPARISRRLDVQQLDWSSDGRWLFLSNAERVVALAMAGQAGSGVLFRLDREPRGALRLAGVDPSQPAIWIRQDGVGWRRVAPASGAASTAAAGAASSGAGPLESPLLREARPVLDIAVDASGTPVAARIAATDHQLLVRLPDGAELARCSLAHRCQLLPRASADTAWMLSDLDGDLQRVLALPLRGGRPAPGLAASERRTASARPADADAAPPERPRELEALTVSPRDGRPLLARFGEGPGGRLIALDPALAAPLAELLRLLPERDLGIDVGDAASAHAASAPAARWLIRERTSTRRGERYHLYDPRARRLRPLPLGPAWPAPEKAALAAKLPMRWRASDGRWLHGYLSVPPGRDLATVPLLLKPHGGPWSATDASYDAATQLLVNRGCAVFEPNFRGSTGHGRAYLLAAGSDFGDGRVQRDIVEGARWLLDHGVGDPARVVGFGSSFGGYASLLGATHTPELYRAAIASAPPPDFGRALGDAVRGPPGSTSAGAAWHDSGFPLLSTLRALGLDPEDAAQRARLTAESPLGAAAALRRPVLLFAGGHDDRVSLRSVIHYAATLVALGKDVSLFLDAEAGHTLEDPLLREAVLYLTEHALSRLVRTPAPAPPSLPLLELLRSRLRLVGPMLAASAR